MIEQLISRVFYARNCAHFQHWRATGTNYVDTDTTGFKVTAAAPAALNAVGGSYIFLAIA